MKYIKKFEQQTEDSDLDNLKVGDYVLVNIPDFEVIDEARIVTEIYKNILVLGCRSGVGSGFTVTAVPIDGSKAEIVVFYGYEITKILSPEEAQFYSSLKKYNI